MSELNPSSKPPPYGFPPVIGRLISVYKLWHGYFENSPKTFRYTLGAKVDGFFLEIIELLFIASYESKTKKISHLETAAQKLDLLKFFLQVIWEIKAVQNKKYTQLSSELYTIGKMLYRWKENSRQNLTGENK